MSGSAMQQKQWYTPTSYALPALVPANGTWQGTLSYGNADFFRFPVHANRTLSVVVDSLDESGNLSENKALPVVGLWGIANPGQSPAPAYTPSAFNTTNFGETRLDAQVLQTTSLRLGIGDYRGDGRPDFGYIARVLYGDRLTPARASVAGGTPVTIIGLGLQMTTSVQIANTFLPILAISAPQILVDTPPAPDGVYDVQLNDPKTSPASTMTGALTIGAGPTDTIRLISGGGPATPVGGQTNAPFAVQVVASDGVTPIAGASVQFSSSPAVAYSACSGASSCTALSDQSGMASTAVTVLSVGTITLTAKLAPASYSRPQQVQVTILGTSSVLDLSLPSPSVWIAQGATVSVAVAARVLSNGNPVNATTVNYQISQGSGILSAASAQPNASGYASVNLQVNSLSAMVQLSVCVGPSNNPCLLFRAFAVALASLHLQPVSGLLQISSGQAFQPAVVRVVDSAIPPHAVLGANVFFQSYVGRLPANEPVVWAGEAGITQPGMPVILASSQATVVSDVNGLVSFPISTGGFSGNIAVIGSASVASATVQFAAQQLGP